MNNFSHKINAVIYFWSGTGNSYRVSTWIGKIAEEMGLNTRIISIDKSNPTKEINGANSLLGIVFPTHGFTAPWHLIKYVWKLPRGNSSRAFCVTTRAGLKFGPVFIPGISGSAPFIVALILMLKGFKVQGTMSVDMPSNWFSLHPIQSRKTHAAIIHRGEKKVARFMDRMRLNKKVWFTINNLYEMTWGIILLFISLVYLLFGRFFLAKLFFANENCNGCGICESYCSIGAIKMWGKKNPKPFWKFSCESCMRCAAFCPHNAIEAGHSWGVLLYFITVVPISAYFFSWHDGYIPGIRNLEWYWIGDMINLIYYYPAIFISYFIFYALIQIPIINWIFSHTTLTHLFCWGRYNEPDTKLKNIAVRKNYNDKRMHYLDK